MLKSLPSRRQIKPRLLGSTATVTTKGETVRVDPQLIFQRLITAGKRLANDPKSLFEYELCSHSPALFETPFLPLKANKASLADVLWKAMKEEQLQPSGDVRYVLDGGALLTASLGQEVSRLIE